MIFEEVYFLDENPSDPIAYIKKFNENIELAFDNINESNIIENIIERAKKIIQMIKDAITKLLNNLLKRNAEQKVNINRKMNNNENDMTDKKENIMIKTKENLLKDINEILDYNCIYRIKKFSNCYFNDSKVYIIKSFMMSNFNVDMDLHDLDIAYSDCVKDMENLIYGEEKEIQITKELFNTCYSYIQKGNFKRDLNYIRRLADEGQEIISKLAKYQSENHIDSKAYATRAMNTLQVYQTICNEYEKFIVMRNELCNKIVNECLNAGWTI